MTQAPDPKAQAKGCLALFILLAGAATWIAWSNETAPPPQPIARDTFAVTIPTSAAAADPESKARDACGSRAFCTVIGWPDGTTLPTAMPLEEDQAAGVIFQFTKSAGDPAGRSLWNCARFPDAPKTNCTDSR